MKQIICEKCKKEFPLTKLVEENFVVCPWCDHKFETKEDVEFSDAQIERNDEIYNAVFELCRVLTEDEDLEWDMSFIGEIADAAVNTLVENGHTIRFPSVVYDDGETYIEEYVRPEEGQQ